MDFHFTAGQFKLKPLFGSCSPGSKTRNWLPFFKCFKSVQCQSKYIVKYDDGPYQFRHQGQERWREWKTWWHKVGLVEGRRRRERWRRWRARRGGTRWLGAEMEAVHFHLLRHLKVKGFCLAIQISLVCGTHHNHPSFSGNHVFTGVLSESYSLLTLGRRAPPRIPLLSSPWNIWPSSSWKGKY